MGSFRLGLLRVALYAAALVVATLIESTWTARLALLGGRPDLVLVLVVALALHRGPELGAAVGLAGGLLQDLVGGQSLGLMAGPKLVVGFLLGLMTRTLYVENVLTPVALLAAATFANGFLELGLGALTGYAPPPWEDAAPTVAVAACYNGVVAPLVFAWVRRAERWFQRAAGTG
ncbi:MAG: rod shape-determining protein MreD [Armatimonadota bacterium]|nr:rod shape-determining protein MreD [Armatimonadota bacterium]MDR5698099.1 rod shape-determining protein MreD [Armatimonadota bacterium]